MAEWFKRGTVNTFYRGSNPLKTLNLIKIFILLKFVLTSYLLCLIYFIIFNIKY